jgi:sporulation protein YlmC with PRC-barrel domain
MLKPFAIAIAISAFAAGAGYAERATTGTMDSTGMDSRATTGAMNYEAARPLDSIPAGTMALSNWQDKNVYDPAENKIGDIKDLLVDKTGKIEAIIVSVGGFLGIGEKDVAVPFNAVYPSQRNNKLTMNATKDTLKSAAGYRYDHSNGNWTVGRM